MKSYEERIFEIAEKQNLSHIGSAICAVRIIDEIYQQKDEDDLFVLSSGHCALALYVVLERFYGVDAEELSTRMGTHPERSPADYIDCSTGSLGQGLPIALGMALADRSKRVYCIISDGESYEGSIWESLLLKAKFKVDNLKIYLNFNGWGAYDPIPNSLIFKLRALDDSIEVRDTQHKILKGQSDHYRKLTSKGQWNH